ncbi:MAG: ABC-2 transporter permease [Planctomycetota bacterium]|nr:ABC-2 transporter permease [Planctomycetota bacterium]
MKASTHTDVYRPFVGELKSHPRRALVLARAGIRVSFKRKLPALILFSPLAIACIVMCFRVHFMFTLAEQVSGTPNGPEAAMMVTQIQALLGDVVQNIFQFVQQSSWFVLIVMAWYGSGQIAEDQRVGANLLYFSRPLSRLEYLGGKFLTVFWFGFLAMVLPCLLICMVATFASPEWSFLKEEWDAILNSILFGVLWVSTIAIFVLAISSLTSRKTYALVGSAGIVFGTRALSQLLSGLMDDARPSILNLFQNMERVGEVLFDVTLIRGRAISVEASLAVIVLIWVVSLYVVTERIRRMEVVA